MGWRRLVQHSGKITLATLVQARNQSLHARDQLCQLLAVASGFTGNQFEILLDESQAALEFNDAFFLRLGHFELDSLSWSIQSDFLKYALLMVVPRRLTWSSMWPSVAESGACPNPFGRATIPELNTLVAAGPEVS